MGMSYASRAWLGDFTAMDQQTRQGMETCTIDPPRVALGRMAAAAGAKQDLLAMDIL
jgi:hypothetical protein